MNKENIKNIDEIRRKALVEIKEKVNRNPKYLHPCNNERLEDMKRLMFVSGNEFTQWMQQNGIMKNPTDVNRKEMEKISQKLGFKDWSERLREWRYETGRRGMLIYTNEDCSPWFGEFTESLMKYMYPGAIKMSPNNPGFDYMWNGVKINSKGKCLSHGKYWTFSIKWNNKTKKFILSGWDNRKNLNPIYAWEFDKDDIVRGKPFWKRDSLTITNMPVYLEDFKDYQIDIGWLKDIFMVNK